MKERQPRSHQQKQKPEYLQASFLAPQDAPLFAELTRLRHLFAELTARYGRPRCLADGASEVFICGLKDVADLLLPGMQELDHEEFRVVLLNSKNAVLDIPILYQGTLNSSPLRVAEVFKPAILANAASIIPVHSHPSGDPTPSPEDVRVTSELVEAGKLLDIECLDHLIIGRGRFVSLKGRGLGF